MAWNPQGGQGPSGGGQSGPQPPDIEAMLRRGQDRLKRFLPGGMGATRGVILAVPAVAAIWLASGFYKVQPGEHIGAMQMKRPGDGEPQVEVDFSTGLYVLDIVVDIDASRSDARNSGLAATVLLQNARDAEKIEFRDPRIDGSDARRWDLRDNVTDRERLASLGEGMP